METPPPAGDSVGERWEEEARFRQRQLELEQQKISLEKIKMCIVGLMAPVTLAVIAGAPAILTSYYQELHRQQEI